MPTATSSTTWRLLQSVTDALLASVLAPTCASCARPLESPTAGPVCERCWSNVRPCVPPQGGGIACRSAGSYEGELRDIIHAFKYEGRRSLARRLAAMMRTAGADVLRDAEYVVPVPLHPWRRFRRGFNQASDLAARLDVPVLHALWRVRLTATQTGLTAAARRRNVRDAFRMSPLLTRAARERLRGRAVVLIDDVRTTGATLDACARVLLDVGCAREVRAVTAAGAPLYPRAADDDNRRGATRARVDLGAASGALVRDGVQRGHPVA